MVICNSLHHNFIGSVEFTLDRNITNCTCFIGNKYNNKIQVVTQSQSTNSAKYNIHIQLQVLT